MGIYNDEPLVSVRLMTYNHEKYIREAMDSIMCQKVNFPVEIVVGDDFSTDNTLKIIREYKSSKFIKINILNRVKGDAYWKERQSKGRLYNFTNILENCKGKYIALLDGDDYWANPLKLQKQVSILEENEEYGVVHGDCHYFYQKKNTWKYKANQALSNNLEIKDKEELFFRLVTADYKVRTGTALFRKSLWTNNDDKDINFPMRDTPLWLDFSQNTKFKYIDNVFTVYRIEEGSVSRPKSFKSKLEFKLSGCLMRFYFCEKYNYKIPDKIIGSYNKLLLDYSLLSDTIERFENNKFIYKDTEQKIKDNLILHPFIKMSKFYLKRPKFAIRQLIN